MIKPFWVLAFLCAGLSSVARQNKTRPLQVGDVLPLSKIEALSGGLRSNWELRGKEDELVILDFMSASCGSCYYPLPMIDSILKRNKKVKYFLLLPDNDTARLYRNFRKLYGENGVSLPVVVDDTLFRSYFPHTLISHVVWLNGTGKVLAITGSEYLHPEKIADALGAGSLPWPVKKDVEGFDYRMPWMVWNPGLPLTTPGKVFYSVFTEEMPGIAPPNGFFRDSTAGLLRFSKYNSDLLSFCQLAVNFQSDFKEEMFVFTRKAGERIFSQSTEGRKPELPKFCYTTTFPLNYSGKHARDYIRNDIRRWLISYGIEITELAGKDGATSRYCIDFIF